jgi:translation initiation factor eIF-2B subunit gamma
MTASPLSHPSISLFRESDPEFVAVVLAATVGTRLLPLTSFKATPKHLLPIAGVPNLIRLLKCLQQSRFEKIVLVLSEEDEVTLSVIEKEWKDSLVQDDSKPRSRAQSDGMIPTHTRMIKLDPRCQVQIAFVDSACTGSAHALRIVHNLFPVSSNLVILPGDLVLLSSGALKNLVQTHRVRSRTPAGSTSSVPVSHSSGLPLPPVACTILLGDVGEVDEHGSPLKESAKSKKGGLGRDEEEIEYIALGYENAAIANSQSFDPQHAPRVVWKQPKVDVEEDKHMDGSTPKLVVPKPRLKSSPLTRVRLDWNDWHVYIISPWVRELVARRTSMLSLQGDMIPLLVSRQFRGRRRTFGGSITDHQDESMSHVLAVSPKDDAEYAVIAYVDNDKTVFRAHTVASYMHSTREFVHHAVADATNGNATSSSLWLPPSAGLQAKHSTVLLTPNVDVRNFKSVVVGRNCTVGAKARLNNCVIQDNVKIGDNVILQNTIVGASAVIGDNSNLNECQVAPGKVVPPGTKEKGESID